MGETEWLLCSGRGCACNEPSQREDDYRGSAFRGQGHRARTDKTLRVLLFFFFFSCGRALGLAAEPRTSGATQDRAGRAPLRSSSSSLRAHSCSHGCNGRSRRIPTTRLTAWRRRAPAPKVRRAAPSHPARADVLRAATEKSSCAEVVTTRAQRNTRCHEKPSQVRAEPDSRHSRRTIAHISGPSPPPPPLQYLPHARSRN